jgi:alpha-D-xyloside xylohydrolase
MAIVDFTNPAACTWWRNNLAKNITIGVDSFKTDFGERIPFRNVKWHDGSDPGRMHNYYSYLYNKNTYQTLEQHRGKSNSLVWARSTTAGGQIFPVHWGGDPESTFDGMAESIRGALSLGICGFGFHSADIGGFEGTPSPTVYKRWVQFGLLQSHSRLHGNGSYRVPWLYDGEDSREALTGSPGDRTTKPGEASRILKEAVDRKICLMPYLLSQALVAAKHGTPMMRAMFLEFPDDLNAYTLEHQYTLGANLLVAPVLSEDGKVAFYVPEDSTTGGDSDGDGKWVSWFDHSKKYTGGKWYTETYDISSLPLLVRPGTITPINKTLTKAQDLSEEGLEFLVNGPLKEEVLIELADAEKTHEVKRRIRVQPADGDKVKIASDDDIKVKVTYL